jgi:Lactate racemase N-terminal domain
MLRVPLLSGSRMPLVTVDDDALLLAPPARLDALLDIGAAVREALRYPLSGPPLVDLVTPGGRAVVVVEARSLPFPDAPGDPRRAALGAVSDELERLGMRAEQQTILIAGGLERRAGRREREGVLTPTEARDFRGSVVVHDAADPDLKALELDGGGTVHIHGALLDADLIVVLTAAETSERGGACTLLDACAAEDIAQPAPAPSLLAPSLSPRGITAGRVAAALARRTPVTGVSILLDHPRPTGRYRGYPSTPGMVTALAQSPVRRLLNALPGQLREHALESVGRVLRAATVLAGPPAVSHAEALLRGISLRGIPLDGPVDTILVPLPWRSLHEPREPLNPITAAAIGLGHALRLWRDEPPLREGGSVILLHDFRRTFGHGPQAPYRNLFHLLREGMRDDELATARADALADTRAVVAYRQGSAPHPLLPYLDWGTCAPALAQSGRVLVAGCRDAGAARALGLVPTHSITAALEMARGVAGGTHRLGVLLAPPYAPLVVGGGEDSALMP